jgi:hypothetical protein
MAAGEASSSQNTASGSAAGHLHRRVSSPLHLGRRRSFHREFEWEMRIAQGRGVGPEGVLCERTHWRSKPDSNPRSQWKTLQGSDSTRPLSRQDHAIAIEELGVALYQHSEIAFRSSPETTTVGRGAALDGRLFLGGTDGSNPGPSSGESASRRISPSHGKKAQAGAGQNAASIRKRGTTASSSLTLCPKMIAQFLTCF